VFKKSGEIKMGRNKKGEGRFSFTFLRREISPAKVEQHEAAIV
jgi:hypothetical protein